MTSERERQFKEMVEEFPDSPMGHFSLGKLYLDEQRYAESAGCLEEATRLDPDYAAAWVALGDAYAGGGEVAKAKEAYQRARTTRHGQRDASLIEDIERRLAEL